MKISSKLFGNNFDEYFISLDIGSEIVKALVVQLDNKNEKAFVLGVGKSSRKDKSDLIVNEENFENIVSVCASAIDDAVAISKIKPRKIIIGLNGNIVRGVSTNINYKRKTNKDKIGEREVKNIISEIRGGLCESVKKIVENNEVSDSNIFITHSTIININIDGYKVINPVGFKGSSIEFTIFNSFMLRSHYRLIKNISEKLNVKLLEIVSQPYAVSVAKGIKDIAKSNIILVDVGEKMTSVAMIHEGLIKGVKTFDIGGKAFNKCLLRDPVSKTMETENFNKKYCNDKIKEVSSCRYEVLLDGIELSLEDFTHINLFSFKILFYGEGIRNFENDKDLISKLLGNRDAPFSEMKIDFIDSCAILKIKDKTNKLKDLQCINSLSLASYILDKQIEKDQFNEILNSAIIK